MSSLEMISLAEENLTLEEDEDDATQMLAAEDHEDDPTEMLSAEEIQRALDAQDASSPAPPLPAVESPAPPFVSKFPTPELKPPEIKLPTLGTLSPPNPFLRPKDPEQEGPKRTLMGMRAPSFPHIAPSEQRLPQATAPEPGSGSAALTGRTLNFGAEHIYDSTRDPQPQADPLATSGHHSDLPDAQDFQESDATAIYHHEPSSPRHPGVAAPFVHDEFQEAEATIVAETPSGLHPNVQRSSPAYESLSWGSPHSDEVILEESGLILDGEDLDDGFAEQKTEVIQSPFEQEAIMPQLRIVEGPMTGQEFILTGLRSTVGRGDHNSVMVEDLAMSRLHFEIIRNADDSYLLRDLGSANGTGLNGTRVKEAVLYHNDRMEAGKSILVFEHTTSPARPHRHMIAVPNATIEGHPLAPPTHSGPDEHTRLAALQIDQSTRMFTRVALGAGALCIPLCFLLIFAIISSSEAKQEATPIAMKDTAQDSGAQQRTRRAAALFLKGAEANKTQSWDEAKLHFEEAKRVDATVDIDPQLRRIAREKEALALLEKARGLTQAEAIIAAASSIPASSVYFDEAQKLIRLNRQDEVTLLHQNILALLHEGKLDEAEVALKELATLSPEHAGLATITQDIQTRRDVIAAELKRQEEEAATAARANGIFKGSAREESGSSRNQADLQKGYDLYTSKKFEAAESAFRKAGGKEGKSLARSADTVDSQWSSGERALASSNWTQAIGALEKARNEDRRINKAHRATLGKDLARAYGNAGLDQLRKEDYRQARKHLASGEKLGVSESSLSKLSRGLEDEAKKIYIRAVNKKKSDPDAALQLCRKIMLMLPSSSITYKKAQKLIFDL